MGVTEVVRIRRLFVAEGVHGVGAGGSSGWTPAGEQRYSEEKKG